ncbi:MAG: (2Fe-2S)-binding protein [Clostridia bacterium]
MPERFKLRVNGREHDVAAEPKTPLLYVLRNDLKLKGARFGCGTGQCGACMVVVDGAAVPSCDTPLWAAAGKDIVTVESERLDKLRQSFLAEQAAQCGYCIDGIMIAAFALLSKNPSPSEEQIQEALDRNLCRCGSHVRILKAIRNAAG